MKQVYNQTKNSLVLKKVHSMESSEQFYKAEECLTCEQEKYAEMFGKAQYYEVGRVRFSLKFSYINPSYECKYFFLEEIKWCELWLWH